MTSRRRRPVLSGAPALSHDPEIVGWVRVGITDGLTREQILAASAAGERGWPIPGRALTKAAYAECRAAIAAIEHLEGRGPKAKSRAARRLNEVARERRQVNGNGNLADLLDSQELILKLTRQVECIEVEDLHLDDDDVGAEAISKLHDDLLEHQEWVMVKTHATGARLGDVRLAQKIRVLENTARRGTPPERANARRKIERIRRQLHARLNP